MTTSEDLFEEYCAENSIACARIDERDEKTPDYQVEIEGTTIIVEVKQFDPSKEDKVVLRDFEKNKMVTHGTTPGDRVRNKIKSGAPQLSKYCKGKHPSILLLYNNLPFVLGDPTEPYNIRVGMFGLDTIVLSVPQNYSRKPSVVDRKSGPKRKLTENHNTSISAVGVLQRNSEERLEMLIYHNQHAEIHLNDEFANIHTATEYKVSERVKGQFHSWITKGSEQTN